MKENVLYCIGTVKYEIRPYVCLVCGRIGVCVIKNGSCAICPREPCQVGNQAALSGQVDVPQTACSEYIFDAHTFPGGRMVLFCVLLFF